MMAAELVRGADLLSARLCKAVGVEPSDATDFVLTVDARRPLHLAARFRGAIDGAWRETTITVGRDLVDRVWECCADVAGSNVVRLSVELSFDDVVRLFTESLVDSRRLKTAVEAIEAAALTPAWPADGTL